MNMKYLIFACLSLSVSATAIAQIRPKEKEDKEVVVAKTKLAIIGGANMSTARVYQNDIKLDSKFTPGYGIGILFEIPFEGKLYFSPGFAYNRRGYEYTPKSGTITKYQNTIHYLDVTPELSIFLPAGKSAFSISAGPYLGVAITGTEKTTTETATNSAKMKFSLSNNYGFMDLGVGGGLGFHTRKVVVAAALQFGLTNINNNAETDFRNIRNRMFSLQVGYYLK
jgi:hypothetical protein